MGRTPRFLEAPLTRAWACASRCVCWGWLSAVGSLCISGLAQYCYSTGYSTGYHTRTHTHLPTFTHSPAGRACLRLQVWGHLPLVPPEDAGRACDLQPPRLRWRPPPGCILLVSRASADGCWQGCSGDWVRSWFIRQCCSVLNHPASTLLRPPSPSCSKLCLKNRHGEDILQAETSGKWVCPRCRGSCGDGCSLCCNCGPCRRAVSEPGRAAPCPSASQWVCAVGVQQTAACCAVAQPAGWRVGLALHHFSRPRPHHTHTHTHPSTGGPVRHWPAHQRGAPAGL